MTHKSSRAALNWRLVKAGGCRRARAAHSILQTPSAKSEIGSAPGDGKHCKAQRATLTPMRWNHGAPRKCRPAGVLAQREPAPPPPSLMWRGNHTDTRVNKILNPKFSRHPMTIFTKGGHSRGVVPSDLRMRLPRATASGHREHPLKLVMARHWEVFDPVL
jgi:hypothetical protein